LTEAQRSCRRSSRSLARRRRAGVSTMLRPLRGGASNELSNLDSCPSSHPCAWEVVSVARGCPKSKVGTAPAFVYQTCNGTSGGVSKADDRRIPGHQQVINGFNQRTPFATPPFPARLPCNKHPPYIPTRQDRASGFYPLPHLCHREKGFGKGLYPCPLSCPCSLVERVSTAPPTEIRPYALVLASSKTVLRSFRM